MSARDSVAPKFAKRCDVARPTSDVAPVMAMTLPAKGAGFDAVAVSILII
jgi:hypothetical protein